MDHGLTEICFYWKICGCRVNTTVNICNKCEFYTKYYAYIFIDFGSCFFLALFPGINRTWNIPFTNWKEIYTAVNKICKKYEIWRSRMTSTEIMAFWDMTPCSGWIYGLNRLHLHCTRLRQQAFPKYCYLSTKLHGFTYHKTIKWCTE
jgi:hypothetical protein